MIDSGWRFWIDVGGTFTDVLALGPDGRTRVIKVLSSGSLSGVAGEGSGIERLADPDFRSFGPNFLVGYKVVIRDASASARESAIAAFDPGEGVARLDAPIGSLAAGSAYSILSPEPAPVLAIRMLMGLTLDMPIGPVDMRLGTTLGTNALLERQGARVGQPAAAGTHG